MIKLLKNVLLLTFVFQSFIFFGQSNLEEVSNVFRINFINPGAEYEFAIGNSSVISVGAGVGYSGAYRNLTFANDSGITYIIGPYLDGQYKIFYNRRKRALKTKNQAFNSGNFFSVRSIVRGPSIADNVTRLDDVDFAFGPTWGIQRSFGKIHFLVDVGPQYYFDSIGNGGFFPFMIQVNLGLNLTKQ